MKDNDFTKFYGHVVLDESPAMMDKLKKTRLFRDIIKKDVGFFDQSSIIDYSLLLGEIRNIDIGLLIEAVQETPSFGHGVYISDGATDADRKAYVIGVIDPLTGFT